MQGQRTEGGFSIPTKLDSPVNLRNATFLLLGCNKEYSLRISVISVQIIIGYAEHVKKNLAEIKLKLHFHYKKIIDCRQIRENLFNKIKKLPNM